MECEHIAGDVVEFGTAEGKSAAYMASLTNKKIWLYDSFEGLPEPDPDEHADSIFVKGAMSIPQEVTLNHFSNNRLPKPTLVKCWFESVKPEDLPEQIAFAHLDGDFYKSIKDSLAIVWPRLTRGGKMVIDDYNHGGLPGVKKAVLEFVAKEPLAQLETRHGLVSCWIWKA